MAAIGRSLRLGIASVAACLALSSPALAQDAGDGGDAAVDAGGGGGADAGSRWSWCPGAVDRQSQPVSFRRMGDVDFGPGTGMRMVGSRSSVGMEYNLLFSGTYDTSMRGTLHMRWPRSLTVTAEGEPMGGSLRVNFGLRMLARIWVLGVSFDVPLSFIIDDNEGRCMSTFTPWAWNFEGTDCHLNVSAWRTLYTYRLNVAGEEYPIDLMVRYNMLARVRTVEIGFPDRSAPAMMARNLGVITRDMPEAIIPAPPNGNLELLTRWKPQLRYEGRLEFRIRVRRRVCTTVLGIRTCTDVDFSAPEFPVVTTNENLPDPFDQMPLFQLPVQQVDQLEIDFGDVRVGESTMQYLPIANPGRSPLAVVVEPPADRSFTLGTAPCIPGGGMDRLPMTFRPTGLGRFRAEISVESNGTLGTPSRVLLVGNGVSTMTVPPNARDAGMDGSRGDGGRARGDGGEYIGTEIDASCACRAAGLAGSGRGGRGAGVWLGLAAAAAMFAARRRR